MAHDPIAPVVRKIDEVQSSPVGRSRDASIQVLIGPQEGAPNFNLRCFTLEAGGMIPAHRHTDIEHEQVVLEGEMVLGLGDQEVTVTSGDCVLIPSGTVHWYENRGSVPVRFLCIVPRTRDYQTEWIARPGETS